MEKKKSIHKPEFTKTQQKPIHRTSKQPTLSFFHICLIVNGLHTTQLNPSPVLYYIEANNPQSLKPYKRGNVENANILIRYVSQKRPRFHPLPRSVFPRLCTCSSCTIKEHPLAPNRTRLSAGRMCVVKFTAVVHPPTTRPTQAASQQGTPLLKRILEAREFWHCIEQIAISPTIFNENFTFSIT